MSCSAAVRYARVSNSGIGRRAPLCVWGQSKLAGAPTSRSTFCKALRDGPREGQSPPGAWREQRRSCRQNPSLQTLPAAPKSSCSWKMLPSWEGPVMISGPTSSCLDFLSFPSLCLSPQQPCHRQGRPPQSHTLIPAAPAQGGEGTELRGIRNRTWDPISVLRLLYNCDHY